LWCSYDLFRTHTNANAYKKNKVNVMITNGIQ
jgi:hypothetical protein